MCGLALLINTEDKMAYNKKRVRALAKQMDKRVIKTPVRTIKSLNRRRSTNRRG